MGVKSEVTSTNSIRIQDVISPVGVALEGCADTGERGLNGSFKGLRTRSELRGSSKVLRQ